MYTDTCAADEPLTREISRRHVLQGTGMALAALVPVERLEQMRALRYDDLAADRPIVAVVQAMEAILQEHAAGRPGSMVEVNAREGGLVLRRPGNPEPVVLYPGKV